MRMCPCSVYSNHWRHVLAKRGKTRSNRMNSAATSIGTTLGHVAAKVDALNKQRAAVVEELREVMSVAQGMLTELGADAASAGRQARKTVQKAAGKVAKKHTRRRKMSAKGRAAISVAAKKRWAKAKAAKKKKTAKG